MKWSKTDVNHFHESYMLAGTNQFVLKFNDAWYAMLWGAGEWNCNRVAYPTLEEAQTTVEAVLALRGGT